MSSVKAKEAARALKFLLFSASAGLIELGAFALLNELAGWPYWPCYLIALVLSVVWNFTLNRAFTFRSTANIPRAMALVALYYCAFTPPRRCWEAGLPRGLCGMSTSSRG